MTNVIADRKNLFDRVDWSLDRGGNKTFDILETRATALVSDLQVAFFTSALVSQDGDDIQHRLAGLSGSVLDQPGEDGNTPVSTCYLPLS